MPTRLQGLRVTKIGFVDRGANPRSEVLLWKRDLSKGEPGAGDVHVPAMLGTKAGGGGKAAKAGGQMYCQACGAKVAAGVEKCPNCGSTDIGTTKPAAATMGKALTVVIEKMSPKQVIAHLDSKHGVTAKGNPFTAHNSAHDAGTYADGQEHDHPSMKRMVYGDEEYIAKRDYSTEQRVAFAKKGWAIPVKNAKGEIVDGRYPIADASDLSNAIQAIGRSNTPEVKAHITKNARRLGLSKQIPDTWTSKADWVEKAGRKISSSRLKRIVQAYGDLGSVLEEVADDQEGEDGEKAAKRREDEVPEFDKSTLDADTVAYIDDLEKKLAEAEKKPPEESTQKSAEEADADVLAKALAELPEPVRKAFEAQETRMAKAEADAGEAKKIAEGEIEKNETREAIAKLGELDKLDIDASKFGPKFRELSKASPELAEETLRILRAANAQTESAELFAELGKSVESGAVDGDSAVGKVHALAKAMVDKGDGKMDEAAAVDAVLQTAEGAKLYDAYMAESNRKKGGGV